MLFGKFTFHFPFFRSLFSPDFSPDLTNQLAFFRPTDVSTACLADQYVIFNLLDIFQFYANILMKVSMDKNVTESQYVKARLNNNGRIVIPAEIRRQMGLEPGDTVLLSVEGDVLKVESHRARIRKVQESMKQFIPAGRALSGELIAERREEARQEMEEWLG
jgi:AbrB family looped-hinge helix DNA binding protein